MLGGLLYILECPLLEVLLYEKILIALLICCPRYMQDPRYVTALGVLLGVDMSQLDVSAGLCGSHTSIDVLL